MCLLHLENILPWQPKVCMPVAERGMGRGETGRAFINPSALPRGLFSPHPAIL